jgi:hypothetical protein
MEASYDSTGIDTIPNHEISIRFLSIKMRPLSGILTKPTIDLDLIVCVGQNSKSCFNKAMLQFQCGAELYPPTCKHFTYQVRYKRLIYGVTNAQVLMDTNKTLLYS